MTCYEKVLKIRIQLKKNGIHKRQFQIFAINMMRWDLLRKSDKFWSLIKKNWHTQKVNSEFCDKYNTVRPAKKNILRNKFIQK